MNIIEFSDWYNEFVKQTKNIREIATQIDIVKQQVINGHINPNDWDIMDKNFMTLLSKWTGDTYIGYKKPKAFKLAFQQFFTSFYDFLLVLKNSDDPCLKEAGSVSLYQGKVYRYIGYIRCTNINRPLLPEYNDIYVSWSKNPRNEYIESKLNGTMTVLECDISGNYFGIDLTAFGVSKEDEDEVVFPTIKECICNIEYLKG